VGNVGARGEGGTSNIHRKSEKSGRHITKQAGKDQTKGGSGGKRARWERRTPNIRDKKIKMEERGEKG